MDVFRTPDERFANLPDFPYEPHYEDVQGLRLHHIDEGTGPTVLCFHGEPNWCFVYRKMAALLLDAGHRVVAPDYVGFGRSDKPTDPAWYSYDRHVEFVSGHLAQLDLNDVTVVVQNWGGPVGLRWALENSERVGRIVVLNTAMFTGGVSKDFEAWRKFAEEKPDLPVGMIMQGGTSSALLDDVTAGYDAPFPNQASKAAAWVLPGLVPREESDPAAVAMRAVQAGLEVWDKPALVAFSDADPLLPFPRAGEVFCEIIPTAGEQMRIGGASHFLQEDRPEEVVAAMHAAFGRP